MTRHRIDIRVLTMCLCLMTCLCFYLCLFVFLPWVWSPKGQEMFLVHLFPDTRKPPYVVTDLFYATYWSWPAFLPMCCRLQEWSLWLPSPSSSLGLPSIWPLWQLSSRTSLDRVSCASTTLSSQCWRCTSAASSTAAWTPSSTQAWAKNSAARSRRS